MTPSLYTYSSGRVFRECGYKYWIAVLRGIKPVTPAGTLWFGTIIHIALETYWKARQQGLADPIGRALATLSLREIDPYVRARARVILVTYGAVWDQVECTVLAVEGKFEGPLFHPQTLQRSDRFVRSGKIDLILRMPDGSISVVEHKTTSMDVSPGSSYRARLALDEQISFYYAGAQMLGFKPNRVIYDVLRKINRKPKKASTKPPVMVRDKKTKQMRPKANYRAVDETADEFEKRLTEIAVLAPDQWIVRIPIVRTIEERKRFGLNVWKQTQMMIHAIDNDLFSQNSDSCFRMGAPCGYVKHCMEGTPLSDPIHFRTSVGHEELIEQEIETEQDEPGDDDDE